MLIYDEPLLSGQPPLSGHLPVPEGGRIMKVAFFLISTADVFFKFPHPHPALKTANGLFTFFVANCEKKKLPKTTKTTTTTTTLYYTENSTAPPPPFPPPTLRPTQTYTGELFKIYPSKIAALQVKAMENLPDSRIWYFLNDSVR